MVQQSLQSIVGEAGLGVLASLGDLPLAQPADIDQAAELLALAGRDQLPFVIQGLGNKLGWALMDKVPRFALSTQRLSGVVEFEPGDGVLTALAGTPMDELQRITREAGLVVTPDIPRPQQATLGGVIAAGQSGIDRASRGPGRLHVLGTRALQLDGSCTKSGGRLVKNVSGYDIHRLFSGSFGSLALITEVSLRLFPLPEEVCLVSVGCERLEDALDVLRTIRSLIPTPHALQVENGRDSDRWKLQLFLTGRREPLAADRERVTSSLSSCSVLDGEAARAELGRVRDLEPNANEGDVIHIGTLPSKLGPTLGTLFDVLGPHPGAELSCQPLVATIDMQLRDTPVSAPTLAALREALNPLGAQVSLRRAAPLTEQFAPPQTEDVRRQLQLRLRRTYDPNELLCTRPPLGV